jgi:hypothetical protein
VTHQASCRCGRLRVAASGEPARVSVCHCLNCKKRSGSAFAAQVRFPAEAVNVMGTSRTFDKAGDSGNVATFHFCPACGSDVFYLIDGKFEGLVAIPLGAFDDPFVFRAPDYSVYEGRKHCWIEITGKGVEHFD